jgi:hypothetical protein
VEVTCTDLQFEDSSGDSIRKWVIRHDESQWHPVIDAQSVSLIHPVVSRIRVDKVADDLDARVSQLDERFLAGGFAQKLAPRAMPPSTVLRRDVWTKTSKTGTAVRKLLVWKTGKESQWAGWPAWIVHFTDYSPDRKTPLERTMRTALTEDGAMAVAAELVTENIKKGWEPATENSNAAAKQPANATANAKVNQGNTSDDVTTETPDATAAAGEPGKAEGAASTPKRVAKKSARKKP